MTSKAQVPTGIDPDSMGRSMWRRNPVPGYGAALVLIVVIIASFASYLYEQRIDALEQARLEQESASKSVAFHVEQSLLAVDLVLRSVIERVAEERLSTVAQLRKKMGTPEIFDLITRRKTGIAQLSVVSIVEKNGDMVNFTRNYPPRSDQGKTINLAERDYFKAHLAEATLKLFISAPVKNKGSGTWTFYLSRKIQNSSGEMIGLVLAGIESAYFEDYFRTIAQAGKNYMLFLDTGINIARFPAIDAAIGRGSTDTPVFKTLRSGLPSAVIRPEYDARLVSNSREYRVVAPSRVSGYPLVVNVRAGESVIFAVWNKALIWVGAFALLLSALILFTAWGWQRTLRQRKITDLEQASARAMHDALVSSSTDAFIGIDANGRIVAWSAMATQMFGWSATQVIGQLLTDHIIPLRHHKGHAQGLARMLQGGAARIIGKLIELPACRADGTEIFVELQVTRVNMRGTQHYVSFVRDITERRAAEERIRDYNEQLNGIFALSPDAFVSFDSARRVKYVNPAFARMTGLDPGKMIGLDEAAFSERLSGICLPQGNFSGTVALRAMQKETAGAGGTAAPAVSARSQRIEIAGAGSRVLEVALRESQSKTVSQILYLRDVTQETEVERLKSEFVSTAAHELRTPMASIYGFTELLLKEELSDEERRDFLETVFKQSELMISIINELLDLARIEAQGGKDFTFERVSVEGLVHEIIASFKTPAGRPSPEEPAPNGALWVRADRKKLTQVLINVLANAYKYSPAGGPVGIEFVHSVPGTPLVGIRITDQGIGMTPKQLGRIFERFYRADTSGKFPGTGLGMSIVHEIVLLHGGEINIDSKFGAGTAVTIWLPADANDLVL
jgi:PAS domain S-box-containing protein